MRNRSMSFPTEFKTDSLILPGRNIAEFLSKEVNRVATSQAKAIELWLRAIGADPTTHCLAEFEDDNVFSRTLVLVPNDVAATRGVSDRAWLEANCPALRLRVEIVPPADHLAD